MAQLSISEVRRELLRAGGDYDSSGSRSSAPAGKLFHEVVAGLMGPDGWRAALEPGELADSERLIRHAYDRLLGPRLTEMQASLRESGAEAMDLWEAVQATCRWFCRLLADAEQRGTIGYDRQQRAWLGAEQLYQPELELRWELREPHWTNAVSVFGVADGLWRDSATGRWCVLEYKLGKPRPEADLAQACLYHSVLTASGLSNGDGAIAVITFERGFTERLYPSGELSEAQAALRALIGRMANVLPEGTALTESPVDPKSTLHAGGVRHAADHTGQHTSQQTPQEDGRVSSAHLTLGKELVRAMRNMELPVDWRGELAVGPRFLRYFLLPGRQAKMRQIRSRTEDLALHLHLSREPMIHNAGGRLAIDVERPDPQTVPFGSIVEQIPRPDGTACARTPLGVDLNGRLQFVDLASSNNPHLLVAGTAGSGKSEWLRSAIAGLILSNTPETLRLVLIDPKQTAFTEIKGSPYLHGENGLVYPQRHSVQDALDSLIEEMERRYTLFEQNVVSDLPEYQAKTGVVLPRIVCVCDEYADLLVDRAATKEVESAISRLGAKARACGIHLIVATQYPDRKTVGGALKMNLSGRVCLRVTNYQQSTMIINQSGGECLLGKGDLFFLSIGDPVRLQAAHLSTEERASVFGRAR